ncbi:MAG: hypothetical protein ACOCWF_04500 [Halochromatium sp.]
MRLNADLWNQLDTFLDTASDAELARAKTTVFNLLASASDRETRSLVKSVYRLIIDEARTRAWLAERAQHTHLRPALV